MSDAVPGSHEPMNQPGPPEEHLWRDDPILRAAAAHADGAALEDYATALRDLRAAARGAERHPPELIKYDRTGRRIDRVEFHPGYHELLRAGLGHGYAALAWEGATGGHSTHAGMVYLHSQVEPATCCPMTMTYAAWPALKGLPDWQAGAGSRSYDPRPLAAGQKAGLTLGMAMTEKQGGSDLRATTTTARRDGNGWRLNGHKWFCSAPMSDGFLTLAQAPGGLTCFLVPRYLPDGGLNGMHVLRLKDKLGNRANASSEIEYHEAWAEQLGDEGAGIRTILTMVHHTRLDTAIAPAGLMRAALREAVHWARHRQAFGKVLIDQPLMAQTLADLALDHEGAVALAFRVALAFDQGDDAFARIGVALAKFLTNKLCIRVTAECMEALGGMGYVEDTALPMLYREAPLNGIWEGSGNVICLDILRSLGTVPACAEALDTELAAAAGSSPAYDAALKAHAQRWPGLPAEAEARAFAEETALLLAAAALMKTAPAEIAEAFVSTRFAARGQIAGSLPAFDPAPVLARLQPATEAS